MSKRITELDLPPELTGEEMIAVAIGGKNYRVALNNLRVLFPVVTKSSLGLDQVDNTSDMDKPISTLVKQALEGKASVQHSHSLKDITDYEPPTVVFIIDSSTDW